MNQVTGAVLPSTLRREMARLALTNPPVRGMLHRVMEKGKLKGQMMKSNEQFLFSVKISWSSCCVYSPSRQKHSDFLNDPSHRRSRLSFQYHLIVPNRQLETVSEAVARLMDEDHGVDTDTDELYSKKEYFIDEVKFIREVRL